MNQVVNIKNIIDIPIFKNKETKQNDVGEIKFISPVMGLKDFFMSYGITKQNEKVYKHYHPYSDETFIVLNGRAKLIIDGKTYFKVIKGDVVNIPKMTPHEIINPYLEDFEVLIINSPLAPSSELGHVVCE